MTQSSQSVLPKSQDQALTASEPPDVILDLVEERLAILWESAATEFPSEAAMRDAAARSGQFSSWDEFEQWRSSQEADHANDASLPSMGF